LTIGALGGFSVLASCFGATVLGMAAWRAQALPRHISGLLLFIGLLTFPLIIALGMIANLWLPAWATDELPFALSGALWVTFGALMQRN
jgi:multidrug transporter EmrE-like cation transporter